MLGAAFEMERQLGGDAVDRGSVDRLPTVGNLQMQAHPGDERQALVEDVLKECMRERVAGRPSAIRQPVGPDAPDEVAASRQLVKGAFDGRLIDIDLPARSVL